MSNNYKEIRENEELKIAALKSINFWNRDFPVILFVIIALGFWKMNDEGITWPLDILKSLSASVNKLGIF